MLTLITVVWYICGALFALYLIICAVCIAACEKAVKRRSKSLFEICYQLEDLFENGADIAENDINSLSDRFALACASKRILTESFDFYRQKELFESAAREYNEAAQRYNVIVDGFPSCAVAKVMGKTTAVIFLLE